MREERREGSIDEKRQERRKEGERGVEKERGEKKRRDIKVLMESKC